MLISVRFLLHCGIKINFQQHLKPHLFPELPLAIHYAAYICKYFVILILITLNHDVKLILYSILWLFVDLCMYCS